MKRIAIIFLIILSFSTIYVSYKNLVSYYWQVPLTSDWGGSELIVPIEIVEKIDSDFPNITNATLPLDAMKMRYYLREGNIDTLNFFLERSIKANPFLGVEQNILSQYLYNTKQYDSAYKLALESFKKLSNNQLHGSVLISSLIKLDSLDQAMKIFESIKYKRNAHYNLLLQSLVEASDTIYLKKYLDESRSLIGDNEDFIKYDQMQKVSYENYYSAEGYDQMAKVDFDKGFLNLSIKKYRKSIDLNPYNYNSYFNLGKILFKEFDDSIKVANKMFRKTIDLNKENGEAYYYLGVTEFILKKVKKDSICRIFKMSLDLGYKDSKPLMRQYGCIL